MSRLDNLEDSVKELYSLKYPGRADWADWLAENHVFMVADFAGELAKKHQADYELSRAAAVLHDIADYKMKRRDDRHEEESLEIAKGLMQKSGYDEQQIAIVVDDAIRLHSCYRGQKPKSIEGKILATADALAHLKSDFYLFATRQQASVKSLAQTKQWALAKINRDYNRKIHFEEVRRQAEPDYKMLIELFSR